jgi:predicted XRE-type DNA-binding protein
MTDTRDYLRRQIRKRFKGEECEALVHRAVLMHQLNSIIQDKGWSQSEAAKKLGTVQPRISELNKLSIDKFSTDLLIKYLYRLNMEVDIKIVDRTR